MKIYQLAHTTPYIGGQVRIDIVLNRRHDGRLHAESLFVVPLSDNIKYTDDFDYKYTNYSHCENIKHLYDTIGDDMFKCFTRFRDTKYWLYNENTYPTDTYDHTYDMGLRRMRYKRYNKQFSFLCPVWVESEPDEPVSMNDLCFEIVFEGIGSTSLQRQVVRNSSEILFDDVIVKYFNDYLALNDNRLLSIRFDNNECFLDGVYAPTGTKLSKDVEYVLLALTSQQRTLLDFDNILCRTITQNRIVAKQLINFNFIFDADDIISPAYVDTRSGRCNMYVDLFHRDANNQRVYYPVKDFYSNYDFVPAYALEEDNSLDNNPTSGHFIPINAFNYTSENMAVATVYTNKICQPIVHWSLTTNDEYIYNLSNIFSSYTSGAGTPDAQIQIGRYYGTPDILRQEYDYRYNNIAFCNGCRTFGQSDEFFYVNRFNDEQHNVMRTENDIQWLHNNKFVIPQTFVDKWSGVGINSLDLTIAYGTDNLTSLRYPLNQSTAPANPPLLHKKCVYYRDDVQHQPQHQIVFEWDDDGDGNYKLYILVPNYDVWIDWFTSGSLYRGDTLVHLYAGVNAGTIPPTTGHIAIQPAGYPSYGDFADFTYTLTNLLQYTHEFLQCYEPPYRIVFPNTLVPEKHDVSDSLLNGRKEIDVCDMWNHQQILDRYSGLMCPRFIDAPNDDSLFYNIKYRYIQWMDNDLVNRSEPNTYPEQLPIGATSPVNEQLIESTDYHIVNITQYNEMVNRHLVPEYPSIGFYSLNGIRDVFGSDSPTVDEYEETLWYKRNRVYVLPTTVNVTVNNWEPQSDGGFRIRTTDEIEELYWQELYNVVFGTPNNDEHLEHSDAIHPMSATDMRKRRIEYLKTHYFCKYNFDYYSNTDVQRVIYYVTFSLY